MYVMIIWIEICLLYVLTSQKKKTKKKKKYKVQCLDVYELFNDCVEHDHFYTRRFLIKDHGFALGVCCLLVPVQSSPQEVTWFRFWWLSAPRGGSAPFPSTRVLARGQDKARRRAQHHAGTACQGSCSVLGAESGRKG